MTKLELLALQHDLQCSTKDSIVDPDTSNEESFIAGFKCARELAASLAGELGVEAAAFKQIGEDES